MLGMSSVYDSKKHVLIGGEIGPYISKLGEESDRSLAVICYEKLQVFCIIEWLSPNKDVFIDIMNLGKSLANFSRAKAAELGHRLFKPISCNETSRFITEGESDYLHQRQDENEEEGERLAKVAIGE